MRAAVELAIDTGRRPEEICELAFDCLARDDDGLPVLVYDNHKANRLGRRLPISEQTATVITTQQQRVARRRYPHTPSASSNCCPPTGATPTGDRAITAFTLVVRAPRLGDQHARAAHRRRHRIRQDQDRALRLPAHLRPTARRRRGRHRRAAGT